MSNFLYNLGTIVDQQFNLSDNKQNSLAEGKDRYGKLGDFANRFDRSAERSYYEDGFVKHSMTPKALQIMSQEPDVTIVIKKKEFSSLKVNYKTQYLDKDEKLFLKASSILFRNKCNQIATYERLSKIERIIQAQNRVDYTMMPILLEAYDAASVTPGLKSLFSGNVGPAMEQIRKLIAYNQPAFQTTWTEDPERAFRSQYGTGTGVIELTTVSTATVNNSIKWGGGSASFTLDDPYALMRMSEQDITLAIGEAFNPLARSQFVNVEKESIQKLIDNNQKLLNQKRAARRVNDIVFKVDPNTYLGKRIRVLIDGMGYEINFSATTDLDDLGNLLSGHLKTEFDPGADIGSSQLGQQGLRPDEKELISSIIDSITSLFSLDSNIRAQSKKNNKESNQVFKRMMLHYCNKSIVQPMDVVHIYMNSKTNVDQKISAGLQNSLTGFSLLSQTSQKISDLTQQLKTTFNPSNASVDIEKSIFVGHDFPNYLWSILRNQFVSDKAGTHVFAGVVTIPSSSMQSPGRWNLSVECRDNTHYFEMGNVNVNPSIESANGPLMDPITPFDIKLDSVTGAQRDVPTLLPENQKFYSSALSKYMAGPQAGTVATQANFDHQDSAAATDGQSLSTFTQNIFYPPDGTVYRWKEGIGTLTLSRATYGNGYNTSIPAQSIPKISTDSAFAGQDIMNIISLLITGTPYNFATFYKTITQLDQYKQDYFNDPSFFRNLQKELEKNNRLWGDFQPFKKLVVSEAAFAQMVGGALNFQTQNNQLDSLVQQRAQLFDRLAVTGAGLWDGSSVTPEMIKSNAPLTQRIKDLDSKIAQAQTSINQSLNSGYYEIYGDDVTYDTDSFASTYDKNNIMNNPSLRKELRRKTNFLTRRLFYKVKSNEDQNLFIVDDSYDKDLDLQAFAKSLANNNISTFLNDYDSVSNQISGVAEKLDLELFADSQGHIQARPPQFNKVPNSVFRRMLKNKEDTGVQIFPQFLQDLYRNQLQNFFTNIEIIEDQIRLYAAALSIDSDSKILTSFLQSANFQFLSDEATGHIPNVNLVQLFAEPDDASFEQLADFTTEVQRQATSVKYAFTPSTQASLLVNRFTVGNTASAIPVYSSADQAVTSRVDVVSAHLREKTGLQPQSIQKLFLNSGKLAINSPSAMDILRITKQIGSFVSTRQQLIKSAASALTAVRDSLRTTLSYDRVGQNAVDSIAFPGLYDQTNVPEVLEHMIEDESYDDFGPGSGARYVIKDHQIMSFSSQETMPEFNFIQVNGLFGGSDGFLGESGGPQGLSVDGNGNTQSTAYAIDYDLWRMYGFRRGSPIQVNALSDPESQLAPYAVSLLNRARGKILSGSLTITGNEYQQVGEVIYIESTNMLWYIESLSHSFTFGQGYTTQMQLSYGHNPGEYIPSAFDVVGKILYKNRDTTNNVVIKEDSSYNEKSLGSLSFNHAMLAADSPAKAFADKNQMATNNMNMIRNIQYSLIGIINPNNETTSVPTIEVRYYQYPSLGINENAVIKEYAEYVVSLLRNTASPNDLNITFKNNVPNAVPEGKAKALSVNLSDAAERRSPSQKAWDIARSLANENSSGSFGNQQALVDGVIDIWLNFGDG